LLGDGVEPLPGRPNVNDAPLILRVDELVGILPAVLLIAGLDAPLVHVTDDAARRYPDEGRDYDDGPDDVVLEEAHHLVYVDVLDYVPESLHHVLYGLLAGALIAEALYAGRPVRQDVLGIDGEAGVVQAHAAASLARVAR
jgi:hypothetical protein